MWFTRFGEYVNQGWKEASLIALIFSVIPFMGWIGSVIMALITLRKGPQKGLILLFITAIPGLVLLYMGMNVPWVIVMLCGNVFTWVLACVLRSQASWGSVLSASVIATIIVAFALNLIVPDLQGFWYNLLHKVYTQANQDMVLFLRAPPPNVNLETYIRDVSRVITPVMILFQVIAAIINLGLARWWQGSLFNPGGFKKEIFETRLSYTATVLTVMAAAAIFLGVKAGWDVLPTLIVVFFCVGIIVFHSIVKHKKSKVAWLWLFYGLMVLLFPYSLVIVAGLGITDTFVDFRARQCTVTKSGE